MSEADRKRSAVAEPAPAVLRKRSHRGRDRRGRRVCLSDGRACAQHAVIQAQDGSTSSETSTAPASISARAISRSVFAREDVVEDKTDPAAPRRAPVGFGVSSVHDSGDGARPGGDRVFPALGLDLVGRTTAARMDEASLCDLPLRRPIEAQ